MQNTIPSNRYDGNFIKQPDISNSNTFSKNFNNYDDNFIDNKQVKIENLENIYGLQKKVSNPNNNIVNNNFNNINPYAKPSSYSNYMSIDVSVCQHCNSPDITYLDCLHEICFSCLNRVVTEDLYNSKCLKCSSTIGINYIKEAIGIDRYQEIETIFLSKQFAGNQIIICPNTKCNEKVIFEKGNIDYNLKDNDGKKLSPQLCQEYSNQRCRCPSCKLEFCVSCNSSPYHIGKNCSDFKSYQSAKKCKYCEVEIKDNNRGLSANVCKSEDCTTRYKTSCTKKLKCGHDCFGHKSESSCSSCLNPECKDFNDKYNQNSEEYCSICYTESLGSAPVVKTKCGHYYHHHCIISKLKKKFVGPKITFGYAECSQCKNWLEFPNNPDLQILAKESYDLYNTIDKMLLERMKFEGLDKDPRLSNPNDVFYNKPKDFGMKSIAYYLCFKCNKPYFAGLRNCLQEDNGRDHDPTQLICGGCGALDGVSGISDCKKHGKEFITYKCRFCCEISSWFCWGTTHFCEPCHSRQCKGDYLTKYGKDKLPKCPGKNDCKLKIDHPQNGEEFALGCTLCSNEKANIKNF